jgi:hypothetical protein
LDGVIACPEETTNVRLRVTGVPTTTGIIHDFMMLNPLPPRHATMRELSAGPPEL